MKESTSWYLFMFCGLIIFVLLGIHMTIMHLDQLLLAIGIGAQDTLKFDAVFARGKQLFFMITYILLLGAALYHGLYGFRTILFELNLKRSAQKFITGLFVVAGLALFAYGTYAAIAAYLMEKVGG